MSNGFWTFAETGGDLPRYTEGACAQQNNLCWYPLPECAYTLIEGEVQALYSQDHGVAVAFWDSVNQVQVNVGSIQIPGGNNDWHPFSFAIPSQPVGNYGDLYIYGVDGVDVNCQNGLLHYSECQQQPGAIGYIDFLNSTFYGGPFNPGSTEDVAIFAFGNSGQAGFIYIKAVEYPNTPNENTIYELDRWLTAGQYIPLQYISATIPDDGTTLWPLGVKVWGDGETEPPWA